MDLIRIEWRGVRRYEVEPEAKIRFGGRTWLRILVPA